MKNSISILMLIGAALIITGCEEQGPTSLELTQSEHHPSFAKATITEFEGIETVCSIVNPGDVNISDGIVHIRGQILTTVIESAEARFAGTNTVVINLDLDPTTGTGTSFGTFSLNPDAVAGTWEGRFSGKITNGLLSLRAVGHGTNDLKGQQIKVNVQGFAPVVDPPCPPVPGFAQNKDTGRILNPQG